MSDHKRIVRAFLADCAERLDHLDRDLVALEKDPDNQECLLRIFDAVQGIEADCGGLGFRKLADVTAAGQHLLRRIRDGVVAVNSTVTTALLAMVDAMRQLLSDIDRSGREGSGDFSGLIEILSKLQETSPERRSSQKDVAGKRGAGSSRTARNDAEDRMKPSYHASIHAAPDSRVMSVLDAAARDSARFHPIPGRLGGSLVRRGHIRQEDLILALREQEGGDRRRVGEILVGLGLLRRDALSEALRGLSQIVPPQPAEAGAAATGDIRVRAEHLERMTSLANDLAMVRTRIAETAALAADAQARSAAQELQRIASGWQDAVVKARMQPIGALAAKFARVIRDAAAAFGKKASLDWKGKDIEVDFALLDALREPLAQWLRGVLEHGIESPEQRAARGKPEEACIAIRAEREARRVILEVGDDGSGQHLPLEPFRTEIERLGGAVDVRTKPNAEAVLRISLPLRAALLPALIASCAGAKYAIPQSAVQELLRISPLQARTSLELVKGAPYLWSRNNAVPLVDLRTVLKLSPIASPEPINIAVLQAAERSFGLIVDRIDAIEEIVVEPCVREREQGGLYAGSANLRDGREALLLDVEKLALRGGAFPESNFSRPEGSAQEETLLLIDPTDRRRLALPLALGDRLEEIEPDGIEWADGQEAILRDGEIVPLVRLTELLGLPRQENLDRMQAVIRVRDERPLGVLVDRPSQTVRARLRIQRTARTFGVRGSAVIQDRVTDVLDLDALLNKAPAELGAGEPSRCDAIRKTNS